jgi:hypothetical protein
MMNKNKYLAVAALVAGSMFLAGGAPAQAASLESLGTPVAGEDGTSDYKTKQCLAPNARHCFYFRR